MDLTDLINRAREALRPGSTAVWTDPSHSYGPAQARITRAPITFRSLPPGMSGLYEDGTVKVDPKNWDITSNHGNTQDITHHEITHSALDSISDTDFEKMAAQNPHYKRIVDDIGGTRLGFMPAEVPAYMSESDTSRYHVPSSLQELYQQSFTKQLQSVDPNAASKYSRMVGRR